jgi:hypothetical protein
MAGLKSLFLFLGGILALSGSCTQISTSNQSGSAPQFFSENIRGFGRGAFDLTLVPTGFPADRNLSRRQIDVERRSSYRLAFFKVNYERQVDGNEGRVLETAFVGEMSPASGHKVQLVPQIPSLTTAGSTPSRRTRSTDATTCGRLAASHAG